MAATPTYHDALSLDVHTLSLLLQRNSSQHHRCIYFRRLSMVLSALRRLPSFDEVTGLMDQWKGHVQLLLHECDGSNDATSEKSLKRRLKEEKWTLEQDVDASLHDDNNENLQLQQQLQQMPQILQQLRTLTTQSLPELTSRILHATSPVLHELSRGYFVPFLTVALACLGRIHAVLLRMGREVVTVLRETVPRLRELCVRKKSARSLFDEGIVDWEVLNELVMPAFQVSFEKHESQAFAESKITASQEWNDLMKLFLDVSQDELTKQMNEFVKGKRWDDAMSRFGLGKSKQNMEDNGGNNDVGDDDGLSSNHDSEAQYSAKDEDIANNNTHNNNDMGEIVNNSHSACEPSTTNNKLSGDFADENMMRVMQQREKMKRQSTTTKPGSESLVSKKKRRKRKKEKKASVNVDGTSSDKEQSPPKHSTDPIEKEICTPNNAKPQAEEAQPKEVKESFASSTVNKRVVAGSTRPDSTDSIRKEDYSDVVKEKKAKKKSSKKAKKQKRKSSSVIDDIFG